MGPRSLLAWVLLATLQASSSVVWAGRWSLSSLSSSPSSSSSSSSVDPDYNWGDTVARNPSLRAYAFNGMPTGGGSTVWLEYYLPVGKGPKPDRGEARQLAAAVSKEAGAMAEDGRFKGVKGSGGYGWLVRLEQPEGSPGANLDWASEATSFLTYWLQFKDGDGVPCRFRAQIITGRAQRYMGTFTVVTVKTSDGSPVDGLDL